jgi:NADH-quinone oxidoreductase subunit H
VDTKTFIIAAIIKIALVVFIMLTGVAYTTWLERKLIGRIQNRWGPTRVGPFGLLQPLAIANNIVTSLIVAWGA